MIERLGDSWRIRTGDGKTMLFGQTGNSRESEDPRVFAWHLDEERDAAGNSVKYFYLRDQGRLYLESVRYSIFEVRFSTNHAPDPARNGRAGFSRVMALRAKAIELHCSQLAPTLMRTSIRELHASSKRNLSTHTLCALGQRWLERKQGTGACFHILLYRLH